jgi:hypothetical protein
MSVEKYFNIVAKENPLEFYSFGNKYSFIRFIKQFILFSFL